MYKSRTVEPPSWFTGKERDAESGNDYFGARYYSSSMGRFMSPDYSDGPDPVPFGDLENPQSLNLYGYVQNNPINSIDEDGHLDCSGGALQDVACAVTAAAKAVWGWLSSGSDNSSVTTSQTVIMPTVNPGPLLSGFAIGLANQSRSDWNSRHPNDPNQQSMIPLSGSDQKTGALLSLGAMFLIPDVGEAEEIHQLLPQQYASFFEAAGIDIEEHTIPMARSAHRLNIGNGVHARGSEGWNQVWGRWIAQNEGASKQQILAQLARMKKAFGIK